MFGTFVFVDRAAVPVIPTRMRTSTGRGESLTMADRKVGAGGGGTTETLAEVGVMCTVISAGDKFFIAILFKCVSEVRNSSAGSVFSSLSNLMQRGGFDPPLRRIFSSRGDFSLGANMGSDSIPPKKNSFG